MSDNFIINTKVIVGVVASIALVIISLTFKNWSDNEAAFKRNMVEEVKQLNSHINGVMERTLRNEIELQHVVKEANKHEAESKAIREALVKQGIYPN